MSVLLQCIECGAVVNEFPELDYAPREQTLFECPACGFADSLLAGQTVAAYAKEFGLIVADA